MFTAAGWLENFSANLAADLLVALAIGIVLAQYLGIRSQRQERRELRKKALELILSELRANKDEMQRVERDWSEGKNVMPYVDTGAWRLASENRLLQGLEANLAALLLRAYAELRNVEKGSRMAIEILFDLQLALRKPFGETEERGKLFKGLAEGARRCSGELDKAIAALECQFAD